MQVCYNKFVVRYFIIKHFFSKTICLDLEENLALLTPHADNTQAELVSSIDGNVQLDAGMPLTTTNSIGGKIKINITKPIVTLPIQKESVPPVEPEIIPPLEHLEKNDEPLPPGEEPIQLNLKPALQGVTLVRNSPVIKGTELTGMCSIM